MDRAFLDTNVILRYLLRDDEVKSQHCLALLEKAERREIRLYTTSLVIAEVVWVLESSATYNVSPSRIRDLLLPIIMLPGLRIANKGSYPGIFERYVAQRIDFVDTFNVASMDRQKLADIYSYDTDFDKIATIRRIEP